jgi:hypothetical protein
MQKNATKCNETLSKWCKNKRGASKIIDTFETYHSSRLFREDRFPELAPVHEFGEFQQNTLLLTALSTSDTEERINLDRRRRGVARSSTGTWSNGGICLVLVLTAHGAARVLLCRCR